jgi:hypothetical protein
MCGTSIFYRCLCSQFPAPFVFLNVKPGTFLETRRPSLRSGNVPQGKLPLSLPDVRNTDQITRVAAIVAYLAADFVFVDAVAILFASQVWFNARWLVSMRTTISALCNLNLQARWSF